MPSSCRLTAAVAALVLSGLAGAGPGAARAAAPYAMGGSPADQSMAQGMGEMQQAMKAAPMTGDPDHDFVAMMIPHHQGAIDMAKVELRYGRDPAMKRLARAVVAAQQREIGQMKAWQAAHPGS